MAPTLRQIDLLIRARWVLPIVPSGRVLENCCVAVDKGRILGLHTPNDAAQQYHAHQTLELDHHVLMPGLVNSHGHAAMTLLRGYADDLPLMVWLNQHIWPAEQRWLDKEFVRDGAELAMAEMLLSGTTCFADMYFFPEATAAAAHRAGMRAQVNFPVVDFATPGGSDADDYIHKGIGLLDTYKSSQLITVGFGPHAPYTLSDEPLRRIATLAEELQAPIQIHLHETASEVADALKSTGQRPIQRLNQMGLFSPLTQCVHMTQLTDEDIALVKEAGASVIHCPESNLKLASGLCPVQKLLDEGIPVALGTDGAASNNDLDMFGEMHTAALIGKLAANDAAAMDAHCLLHMATLGGAKALGLDGDIGSLEAGKAADMIAVRLDDIASTPLYQIPSQLVYTASGHRVSHSWVAGKMLLREGQLTSLSRTDIVTRAQQWQERLQQHQT